MGYFTKFNILHVEKDQNHIALVRAAFRNVNFDCDFYYADEGECALKMLRRQNGYGGLPMFDLILLSNNIPDKCGLDILQEIRADQFIRDIPVILLFSNKDFIKAAKAFELRANSSISKIDELISYTKIADTMKIYWQSSIPLPNRIDF